MTRHGCLALCLVFAVVVLAGCADKPVVVAVSELCVSTSRYHATEQQVIVFKADQALWQPLVDWLASFNRVRDETCLKPVAG